MDDLALERGPWLEVTTTVGCKNLCAYCPQDVFVPAYPKGATTRLALEDFRRAIDRVPPHVKILFAGFSDPWLNPECTEMLIYAHGAGHAIEVYTVGTGMTPEDVERIAHVPFRRFALHLPDDGGLMRTRVDARYLALVEAIVSRPLENLNCLYLRRHRGTEQIHPEVGAILSRHATPLERWPLTSRAGNVRRDILPKRRKRTGPLAPCPRLEQNVLLPNGDVHLCCMDWKLEHRLGNLLEEPYSDLFRGEEMRHVRASYPDDTRETLCRFCDWARPAEPLPREPAPPERT